MKNVIMLLLLFAFVFSSPEEAPLSYTEMTKRMNIEINQCVNNGQVSDKVKALLKEAAEEDIRKTLKPILKELKEDDLVVIRNCRKTALQKLKESLNN